jgi:hypothetical protein
MITASKDSANQKYYHVSMQYTFDKFITPLLPKKIFDHYVVFSNGNVVYEDFPSGLSYKYEDSLLQINKGITGASIIDQKVGGEDYKIFLQPVSFGGNNKWIIAGLHSVKKYNAEKRQLPPKLVLFLIIIAFGLLLFIPWKKIYNIGSNDRLRPFDAGESALVAKLFMSLLFFCFFWFYKFWEHSATHSKKILAAKIDWAFNKDVIEAYKSLVSFDSLIYNDSILQNDIGNLGGEIMVGNVFKKESRNRLSHIDIPLKNKLDSLYKAFPVIELNWLDSRGTVKYNWTISENNFPHANYKSRDYFKNTIALIPHQKKAIK